MGFDDLAMQHYTQPPSSSRHCDTIIGGSD
jgi:hypothetical protein